MKKIILIIIILLIGFGIGISYLFSRNSSSFSAPMSADELEERETE